MHPATGCHPSESSQDDFSVSAAQPSGRNDRARISKGLVEARQVIRRCTVKAAQQIQGRSRAGV